MFIFIVASDEGIGDAWNGKNFFTDIQTFLYIIKIKKILSDIVKNKEEKMFGVHPKTHSTNFESNLLRAKTDPDIKMLQNLFKRFFVQNNK